jgi:hypothetical protein
MGWQVGNNTSEKHTVSILTPEEGETVFFQSISFYLPVYLALQPKKKSSSLPREPQNSHNVLWSVVAQGNQGIAVKGILMYIPLLHLHFSL